MSRAWPAQGTYVLILRLQRRRKTTIGRLGAFELAPGYYSYVGSAFGPGGLAARLRHHLDSSARSHWHIDYLRRVTRPVEVWVSGEWMRREHTWARLLEQMPGSTMPIRKFGSSDCSCASHLFHFAKRPSVQSFAGLARTCFPRSARVHRFPLRIE